jgi:Acetyltransferase (GNAT) domain
MSGWTLSCYGHPREFDAPLRAFLAEAEREDVEFGPDWFANLVSSVFPEPGRAAFFVLRQGSAVRAVLPLLRVPRRFGLELHSLSNYYTSRWRALGDEAALGELLRRLRMQQPGLSALRLDALDADAPATQALLQALAAAGFSCHTHFRFKNWRLETAPDWAAYLASRKGKQRSDLKRMGAKLQADGGTLSIVRGGAELERALADYQAVYATSWKQAEPYVDFVPGLVRLAAARGWLRLGRVHLGGQVIAAQIWFVHAGRAGIFKVAYDEAFKTYSPGSLCTAHLMQSVMQEDGVGHVDYLIGDDAYKRLWMNQCRDRIGLAAFNLRAPLGCWGALREWLAEHSKPWRQRLRVALQRA